MLNRTIQRSKLIKRFEDVKNSAIIFLKGGEQVTRYPTVDTDIPFRQESQFWFDLIKYMN